MNYIRTKDGAIYDLKSKEISSIEQKDCWVNIFYYNREKGQYLEWDDNGGRSMDTIYKAEILKQSENLEELCDEFVMTHYFPETNYTKREVLKDDKDLMIKAVRLKKINNKDKELKNEFNIFGCIWIEIKLPNNKTVFRLEPVVIMNDEGNFELI